MSDVRWREEPDIDELRRLHALLASEPEKAVVGLEMLANRGSPMSMWYLADSYMNGRLINKDLEKARYWYRRADQSGNATASYMLGRICIQLNDFDAAFTAFSRGTNSGYAPAIYRLAKMYHDGCGTQKDANEYRRLLEVAVSKGHIFSKRDLAILYLKGKFGFLAFIRGLILLSFLAVDIVRLFARIFRPGSNIDEQIFA